MRTDPGSGQRQARQIGSDAFGSRCNFFCQASYVSGKVSADGKTFLTDIDSEWQVSNADALKGHEGRLVRVRCYVDTEKSSIKILSVKGDDNDSNYAARNTDSAFRR